MTAPYLSVQSVVKDFQSHRALDHVSFEIPASTVFGLVGPNGAGKTTLIRIINQITAPDNGTVLLNGRAIEPSDTARIGYLPEERGLYKKMKVLEQIVYFGQLKDLSRMESLDRALKWMKRFGIEDWRNKKIEELSKGMQQKIQFIITVLHEPDLIILDEPFSGFDPVNTKLIKEEIQRQKERGATIIFSTHRMESIEEICDHVGMIHKSRKVLEGRVDEVRKSYSREQMELEFKGEPDGLNYIPGSLTDMGEGRKRVVVTLEGTTTRDLLRTWNERVELFSFSEKLPSMEEIFIEKVKEGDHE